jgi:hypothetical protein
MASETQTNIDKKVENLIDQQTSNTNKYDPVIFTSKVNLLLTQKIVAVLEEINLSIQNRKAGQQK